MHAHLLTDMPNNLELYDDLENNLITILQDEKNNSELMYS